jgi:DNA-binding XRE family transcriptional regulator
MKRLNVAKKLRWLREHHKSKLSQEELGAAAGISRGAYNAIECGRNGPSMTTLIAILKKLGACLCDVLPNNGICPKHKLPRKKKIQKARRPR